MVERVKKPWAAKGTEETFATSAEAERAEGRIELASYFAEWIKDGSHTNVEGQAEMIVHKIEINPALFVALLRKAGVPLIVRERKAKVAPAKPKAAAA